MTLRRHKLYARGVLKSMMKHKRKTSEELQIKYKRPSFHLRRRGKGDLKKSKRTMYNGTLKVIYCHKTRSEISRFFHHICIYTL